MVGQHYFSHKELQGVNCNQIQNKLLTEKDINWNNYPTYQKRGSCCIKMPVMMTGNDGKIITRDKWQIDTEIPIFTNNRNYIKRFL